MLNQKIDAFFSSSINQRIVNDEIKVNMILYVFSPYLIYPVFVENC